MSYTDQVLRQIQNQYPHQIEYCQAVGEVLESLRQVVEQKEDFYRQQGLLERLVQPERVVIFRVP